MGVQLVLVKREGRRNVAEAAVAVVGALCANYQMRREVQNAVSQSVVCLPVCRARACNSSVAFTINGGGGNYEPANTAN